MTQSRRVSQAGPLIDDVLLNGRIDAVWLRKALFADGKIRDEERTFLHELKGEAELTRSESEALFGDATKMPQEPHTCGSGE